MQSFKEFGEYILRNSKNKSMDAPWVHIILNYPKIKWDEWAEYMATLTWFSGIPLGKDKSKNFNIIFAETIDEALEQCDNHSHAIISYIGSFYYSKHEENIFTHFDKFCNSDHPCRGHLLFHPNKEYGRLHPQTIFLNLNHWRKIGKPSFGYYTGKVLEYERSISNVHDDYTPHWVKGGNSYIDVTNAEQGEYLSKVFEDGKTILNFDAERRTKFFCYPERRQSNQLDEERNRQSNIIYVKNNEGINHLKIAGDTKFDVIYAPAAGSVAEYLYELYGHENTKLVIYDNNPDSIKWKQMVYQMAKTESDLEKIAKYFKTTKDCRIDACEYKPQILEKNEKLYSTQSWLNTISKVNAEIIQFDIFDGPFNVDPTKKNFIYLSNIFSYNFIIHKMRIEDIHNKFLEYCQLPNTVLYGKNVFKDSIYHENYSS